MNAVQLVDFHDVEVYLKTRKLVDDRHLPYFIRWLQRFLTGSGRDSSLSAEDAHRAFLEQLERSGTVVGVRDNCGFDAHDNCGETGREKWAETGKCVRVSAAG